MGFGGAWGAPVDLERVCVSHSSNANAKFLKRELRETLDVAAAG